MTTQAPRQRSRAGSETRQRDKKIDVRFSDDERDVVREAASRAGLTPAAFLRISALERAKAS